MTFDFDLIWDHFWGQGRGQKLFWSLLYVVDQLSFFVVPSIMTFDFDLMWVFFTFKGPIELFFGGWSRVQKLFWGLLI